MAAGDDLEALTRKWDARYAEAPGGDPEPTPVLRAGAHLLPEGGAALDLACGRGGDALYLAARGLEVTAWDLSSVAIAGLSDTAAGQGVRVNGERRDVIRHPPPADAFDVIVVGYFLDRGLFPRLIEALRPGGLLFYETFTAECVDGQGPANPLFRLGQNELLALVADHLLVRFYREEGVVGDPAAGCRNVAQLIGQRP